MTAYGAATPPTGLDALLRGATAGSIRLYQVWLSPYKGFCCAYRHRTGRCSCSEYARRLVLRRGPLALLQGLPRQFARCRQAYAAIQAEAAEPEEASGPGEQRAREKDVRRQSWSNRALDACSSSCNPVDCSGVNIGTTDCVPCDCSF